MNIKTFHNVYSSVYDHINDLFVASGLITGNAGDLTLMDAYPDDDQIDKIVSVGDATGVATEIVLPVLTIEEDQMSRQDFEIGSDKRERITSFISTVFAETHVQRNFILGLMEDYLDRTISLKDFNDSAEPEIGYIYIDNIRMVPLKFSPTPNTALRWGADIFFDASNIST